MEPRVAALLRETRQAVIEQPDSAEAWFRYAAACDAHKIYDHAIPAYRRAVELAPTDFQIVYNFAIAFDAQKTDSATAIGLFERAAHLRADYPPVQMRLGDAAAKRGRLEEAKEAYGRAVALDPQFARAHRGLGQVLLALDEVETAVGHLEHAETLGPGDGPTTATLAQAYARLGDRDRAADAARRYAGLPDVLFFRDPQREDVLEIGISSFICRTRARRYLQAGDYERAVRDLMVVVEVKRDEPHGHYRLGFAALRTRQFELAEQHLFEAVRLKDDFAEARLELAALLMATSRHEPAIAQYRRVLAIDPDRSGVRWQLAAAIAQNGQLEDALVEFAQAESGSSPTAVGLLNWGAALMQSGDLPGAVERLRGAVELAPDYALAQYNLGVALERAGRIDEAIVHLQRAVEIDPTSGARQRLQRLVGGRP